MKTTRILILRNSVFVFALLWLALWGGRVSAQSPSSQSASSPIKPVARITQAIDESRLVPMQNRVHPLARPEFDRGVVPDSQPMNRMMLVLKRGDTQQAALTELMNEQQTKNSPNYHAWLTPTQFGQQFGVADADVQTLTNWLTQKGFIGIKLHPGGTLLEFSGTAGKIRAAFHTEIHQFMVDGELHIANVSAPQMPAALAPVVASVHTLHNFRKKSSLHFSKALLQAKAKAAAEGTQFTFANVCPNPPNGSQPCAAMAPGDFAKIYNLPANLDGTGQTIALVARSNVQISDINQFGTGFGISNLSSFSAANNVVLAGPDPGLMAGDQDEATLDVEWSGAVAPKAKILLVPSDIQASTPIDGVDLSALFIIENNLAQIMSQSFGACEQGDPFESIVFEQAAAQGITVLVSTGDTGSASCDPDVFSNASDVGLAISGSASTSFNVAVGGTDFDDAANPGTFWNTSNSGTGLGSAKSYIPETPWNGGCAATATSGTLNTACSNIDPNDPSGQDLSGGGGGQSSCATLSASNACLPNPKPAFQQLAGLTGMPAANARNIPDVSLYAAVNTASNHFYIVCEASTPLQNGQPCVVSGANLNFSGVGGTSASTPAFAGIVALVNQNEVNNSRLKAGEGQGNINFVLYKLAVAQYANAALNCNSSTGPGAACTFNDVTKGNNSVPCVGSVSGVVTPNCSTQTANAIGVLVEPTSATTPGWSTTPGYDLATGLGSVNTTNLVNNWPTVVTNFKSSTTTVTSTTPASLTNLAHGSAITFNISVTGSGGTPSGDVSLVPSEPLSSTGTIDATLTSGTVALQTNQLPGGTYIVVVHYAGDGTFAASDSAAIPITVNKEASAATTTMWQYATFPQSTQLIPPTAAYGSPYLLRVDVVGSQGQDNQPCSTTAAIIPCPTGKVTFTADGNPLNDFLGNGGAATNSAILNSFGFVEDRVLGSTGLSAGAHSIGASYAGDNSYNASAAPALPITITQGPTQTSVALTANGQPATTITSGQSVTLTATVLTFNSTFGGPSNAAGPTGTITFSSCGTAGSCTVTVVPVSGGNNTNGAANATAALNTTFTAAGPQTVTATYSGDTNYTACTANGTPVGCTLTAAAFTVTAQGSVAVASSALTLNSTTGASASSTITVTPSGGFTGNVVVTATAASLPPGVTCPNSPLTINVTGTTPVTGTLNCQVTATSTTLTASNFEQPQELTAKATQPTHLVGKPGSALVSDSANSDKGWLSISAGTGFAALFLFFLPGGRKRLRVALGLTLVCLLAFTLGCNGVGSYGGGGGGGLTATVTKLTVSNGNVGKIASGTAFNFSVTVTGGTPTGMVQLFDGATSIGTAVAVSSGAANLSAPATLAVGTHGISAHYLGDSTTSASASGAVNVTVTGNTTIAITTTPTATPAATPIQVTVQ